MEQELKSIIDQFTSLSKGAFEELVAKLDFQTISKGVFLRSGQQTSSEYFILSGIGRLFVNASDGVQSTIDFLTAPGFAPPLKTRIADGKSSVSIEAISDLQVAIIDTRAFFNLCVQNHELMNLGTKMIEACLLEKSKKEIALATMKGNQRLKFFRVKYPTLENHVPHLYIASYLGLTNVSLSRLRAERPVSTERF